MPEALSGSGRRGIYIVHIEARISHSGIDQKRRAELVCQRNNGVVVSHGRTAGIRCVIAQVHGYGHARNIAQPECGRRIGQVVLLGEAGEHSVLGSDNPVDAPISLVVVLSQHRVGELVVDQCGQRGQWVSLNNAGVNGVEATGGNDIPGKWLPRVAARGPRRRD